MLKKQSEEKPDGAEKEVENQTDQEKSVLKRTAALIEVVCSSLLLSISFFPFPTSFPFPYYVLDRKTVS